MTKDKEGSSTSKVQENIALKCVQLTDSNYTTWAVLMETILKAYGLWETINPKEGSSATDEKKTHTTKAMIFQTIPQDILAQVAQYETAKEVWDSVKVRYLGADLVQKARLQTLRSELETLKMKEDERVQDFSGKLGTIKAKFASLGTTLKDKIIVRKLLNSVPKKFLPIVATIEQYSEIDTMPFEEAVGRITAYEERIKSADEPEEYDPSKLLLASTNNSGNGLNERGRGDQSHGKGRGRGTGRGRSAGQTSNDKSRFKCYECGEYGHFAYECTKRRDKEKEKEEEAHLVWDDEEPALL
ncbi:zinc finger, CCHC-type containing protein [Tanacetum coccineum]